MTQTEAEAYDLETVDRAVALADRYLKAGPLTIGEHAGLMRALTVIESALRRSAEGGN